MKKKVLIFVSVIILIIAIYCVYCKIFVPESIDIIYPQESQLSEEVKEWLELCEDEHKTNIYIDKEEKVSRYYLFFEYTEKVKYCRYKVDVICDDGILTYRVTEDRVYNDSDVNNKIIAAVDLENSISKIIVKLNNEIIFEKNI